MTRSLLLIHGVGDIEPRALESEVLPALRARLGSHDRLGLAPVAGEPQVIEYNWNAPIARAGGEDWLTYLGKLRAAMRRAAGVGIPESLPAAGAPRAGWLPRILWSVHEGAQRVLVAVACWVAIARAATALETGAEPLRIGLPLGTVLFPPLPPAMVAESGRLATQAAAWVGGVVLATGVAILLVRPFLRPRLAAASILRRLAIKALQTVVHVVLAITTLGVLWIGLALAVSVATFLVAARTDVAFAGVRAAYSALAIDYRTALAGAAVIIVLLVLIHRLLRAPVKILADIFRYLGDPGYRERLLDDLAARAESLPRSDHLIIAAHSLGSVIAVDSLLDSPGAWSRFPRLTLVTLGSPLRRLFARFFPGSYATPAIYAGVLGQHHHGFAWINVYRPLDYVGASLAPGRQSGIADIRSTASARAWPHFRQWTRTHTGYWSDAHVIDLVMEAVARPSEIVVMGPASRQGSAGPLEPRRTLPLPAAAATTALAGAAYAFVLLGGAVLMLVTQFSWNPRQERQHLESWRARLDARGLPSSARICPGVQTETREERWWWSREVVVLEYRPEASGGALTTGSYSWDHPHVDWEGLRQWLQTAARDAEGCAPLPIVYDPGSPAVFAVPGFVERPSYYSAGRLLIYAGRSVVVALMWLVYSGALFFALFQPTLPDEVSTDAPGEANG